MPEGQGRLTVSDQQHAVKRQSIKGFNPSVIPYGQIEANVRSDIKRKLMTDWPPSLISFDVWRTMTLYDPEKDDGGPNFQQLMSLLLMHPGTYKEGAYDGSYWLANEQTYGKAFHVSLRHLFQQKKHQLLSTYSKQKDGDRSTGISAETQGVFKFYKEQMDKLEPIPYGKEGQTQFKTLAQCYGEMPFSGQGPETQSIDTGALQSAKQLSKIGLHLSVHTRPTGTHGLKIGNNQSASTGASQGSRTASRFDHPERYFTHTIGPMSKLDWLAKCGFGPGDASDQKQKK